MHRIRPKSSAAIALGLLIAALATVSLGASARAVGPYPDLGSCQVFPDPPASLSPRAPSLGTEAAWNQDISKAPRDPRSSAYVAYIDAHGGESLHPDFGSPRPYGFPYSVVGPGQRMLPVHYTAYGDESDPGPFPVPGKAPVEGGNRSDGDRHVLVVDRAGCRLYELYRAFFVAEPRPHWNADSGTTWDLRSAARRPEGWTSADAAGLPIFPGLVRYDEAASGRVEHAIRVTVESTRNAWVHPASHCAGDSSDPSAPPMGLRLRLKAGYGLGRFSGPARAIAVAMKRYGLIVADNGSNWFFSGTSDCRWDDENLNQLKGIPGSAFEAVKSAAPVHAC
ncbi:MAG TPA: hypothetical protein VHP56_03505 [Solirubrobacterales bacterium]|jgi:hypothetical protein|nr:hypothetical protein [Solirubrobacterales bacterium]